MKNPTFSQTMDMLHKQRGFNKGVTLFEKNAKLIDKIYADFLTGNFTLKELGKKYHTNVPTVSKYITYKMSKK